jgi:hypothetical protein
VLRAIASGRRPLSHAALDELPPSQQTENLRIMLVATGALAARDEYLAQLQRWITQVLASRVDPGERELLHRYAVWHLLRRLRQRNREHDTRYTQVDVLRQEVRAAIGLLDWLRARGLTLEACRQADLDEWLAGDNGGTRSQAGHFVRWASAHRVNPALHVAAVRWTGPAGPLDQEQRWQSARRLLHDDSLDTVVRVAGLLVLLYAQMPSAISRLTLDDIDTSGDALLKIRLGTTPVTVPEPLAGLIRELTARRHGQAVLGDTGTSRWLFPGGQPGRPVGPSTLAGRLHKIGIHPARDRSAALFQLATELPAAVLARTLGIHVKVATEWQHASAGDWGRYAADVSRRPLRQPVPSRHVTKHQPGRDRCLLPDLRRAAARSWPQPRRPQGRYCSGACKACRTRQQAAAPPGPVTPLTDAARHARAVWHPYGYVRFAQLDAKCPTQPLNWIKSLSSHPTIREKSRAATAPWKVSRYWKPLLWLVINAYRYV